MSNDPRHNSSLTPEDKRALLSRLLREKAAESSFAPLSFAQQRLWFLDRFDPGNPVYNIRSNIRLTGRLDVPALEQSFNEIARRHENLRTAFATIDGQPIQVIAPDSNLTMPVAELQELPEAEREAEVKRRIVEENQWHFDLAEGPLMRTTLLKLGEEEHVLLLTLHHIVSDGWSTSVLIRELTALYEAFSSGKPSSLPELPIQYADFASWQRDWLQGAELENQLSYWKRQLSDISVLQLQTDHPRPAVLTFKGRKQRLELSKTLSNALKDLSRQEGSTLFMTLLAAFKTLLFRYSDQGDIVVGSPLANRNRTEIEGLIGFFVNTLVMRTDLSGNPSFRALLKRVRETALGAYAHQDLPFEKLVEELRPERDISRNPLFQVMFLLQNVPASTLHLPGLTWEFMKVDSGTSKFDLTLAMVDTEQGLVGSMEYNTDLFETDTITRMLNHFRILLEGIAADPDQVISALPVLSGEERSRLVTEWNDTVAPYPEGLCLHELFEDCVERAPDAVAVVFEGEQLTYHELNARANQVARHLRTLGAGPEVRVGICLDRSVEMIVGLLGILKAGAAYVPLDPSYPKERLSFMLEDAQVPVLLTQEKLVDELPEYETLLVCVDRDAFLFSQHDDSNLGTAVLPSNLAYVIYTSGSTGKPKGVKVTHHGLCNLATAQSRVFGVSQDSSVLQFASLSFDASISEVAMTLCSGAKLCLSGGESLLPGPALIGFFHEQAITHVTLPPSVLAVLPAERLTALQSMIIAGEVCSPDHVAQWSGGRRFFNAYGPTETTVCATIARCDENDREPTIGRPMANMQVYVLDRNLQPVPVGVKGELCVGGVGLAREYHNQPVLTAERFVPNPFGENPGARLYRTGDLARYLPEGDIDFLGRIDRQVKVRGFRIELGEIESALSTYEGINECVVVASDGSQDDTKLIAYTVAKESISSLGLRRFLREILPDYMIPAQFIQLDSIPLTSSGKVDHKLLESLKEGQTETRLDYVPPQSSMEKKIAGIWQEVLSVDKVGVHDNFFDLGGHSLSAIRVISKMEDKLKIKATFRDFINQTLGQFAASYEEQKQ